METRHPSHHPEPPARLTDIALGWACCAPAAATGTAIPGGANQAALGSQEVPAEWLEALERLAAGRSDETS